MTDDDKDRDRPTLPALFAAAWVAFFALATAVSAAALADVRAPALADPFYPYAPRGAVPDLQRVGTLAYCVFSSATLMLLGVFAAVRRN